MIDINRLKAIAISEFPEIISRVDIADFNQMRIFLQEGVALLKSGFRQEIMVATVIIGNDSKLMVQFIAMIIRLIYAGKTFQLFLNIFMMAQKAM